MKRHTCEEIQNARNLRLKGLSLPKICDATGFCKSMVYSWIKDMTVPDGLIERAKQTARENFAKYRRDTQKKWRDRRESNYKKGWNEAENLLADKLIRDFVCIYMAEGYKRSNNIVSLINTDPVIISLCIPVFKKFSSKKIKLRLWCSVDEKDKLKDFWAKHLLVEVDEIRFVEKKQVSDRRAEFGLLAIEVGDTDFRQRLGGWMDWLKSQWTNI